MFICIAIESLNKITLDLLEQMRRTNEFQEAMDMVGKFGHFGLLFSLIINLCEIDAMT